MRIRQKVQAAFVGNGEGAYPTIINREGAPTLVVRDEFQEVANQVDNIAVEWAKFVNYDGETIAIDTNRVVDFYDTKVQVEAIKAADADNITKTPIEVGQRVEVCGGDFHGYFGTVLEVGEADEEVIVDIDAVGGRPIQPGDLALAVDEEPKAPVEEVVDPV